MGITGRAYGLCQAAGDLKGGNVDLRSKIVDAGAHSQEKSYEDRSFSVCAMICVTLNWGKESLAARRHKDSSSIRYEIMYEYNSLQFSN